MCEENRKPGAELNGAELEGVSGGRWVNNENYTDNELREIARGACDRCVVHNTPECKGDVEKLAAYLRQYGIERQCPYGAR